MDQRFDAMDQRFDVRFDAMDQRFDASFGAVDVRFGAVDDRLGMFERHIDDAVTGLKHELLAAFRAELNAGMVSQTRAIVFSVLGSVTATVGLVLAAWRFG
ncbi:MAG: hypothetical protein ACRDU8_05785, partial [Egibacteraceae bacterium]